MLKLISSVLVTLVASKTFNLQFAAQFMRHGHRTDHSRGKILTQAGKVQSSVLGHEMGDYLKDANLLNKKYVPS